MNKEQLVDELLNYFFKERHEYAKNNIPEDYPSKRLLLRGLINIRMPQDTPEDILKLEDKLLSLELKEKQLTDANKIAPINSKICIWFGDITTLKIDAIVNACNDTLLGCFIPNHSCIDNAIHSASGIRLRLECNSLMQGKKEKTGSAKITKGYNLPCQYVIHTVGPIIHNDVTEKDILALKSCYIACLDIARKNGIKTIAFPTISTGVFHFPKDKASEIAFATVNDYLKNHPNSFEKVIFDVFTEEDYRCYERLFKNKTINR